MERGLLWLPLLVIFFWLVWSGWNEYQKVELYQVWAKDFDKAKYDIYAVLGIRGNVITWGKPTRSGICELNSFSLEECQRISLLVNTEAISLDNLPTRGKPVLEFILANNRAARIPFTEIELAAKWCRYLQEFRFEGGKKTQTEQQGES